MVIQLSSIKEKLSWQLYLFITLYLVAAVILFALFIPARNKTGRLQADLDQLERNLQSLVRIVETRPALEANEREIGERLLALGQRIPSQYDLPAVLDVLSQLSSFYGVRMDALEHVPLKLGTGSAHGVIPLSLKFSGSPDMYGYIIQMQKVLPTLQINEVVLHYTGGNQLHADLRADLQVLVLERAVSPTWITPPLTRTESFSLPAKGFGLPFEVVAKFLQPNVRVLGVVEAGRQSTVLLSKDGVKRWYQVGERVDEAVVSGISANGVWLNVDGVQLKLIVGS